ncbi:acyl carrier protein [Nocardia niigatensis]
MDFDRRPAARSRCLRDLDRRWREAARLLGHESTDALDPERDFLEVGFDALAAMELRITLHAFTGLPLPTAAIFDHKAPAAVTGGSAGSRVRR